METPHLSTEYYKAKKNYNLFTGLLFGWEFVGIEITKTPIQNLNITLKSPEAAPYIIIVIMIFFSLRTIVEWHQSAPERRNLKQSLFDFYFSHTLAITAIGIFYTQTANKIQVFYYLFEQLSKYRKIISNGISYAFSILIIILMILAGISFIKSILTENKKDI